MAICKERRLVHKPQACNYNFTQMRIHLTKLTIIFGGNKLGYKYHTVGFPFQLPLRVDAKQAIAMK